MFVQELELDSKQSYYTTTTVDNLVENLRLKYNHIPIICLSSKDSWSDSKIEKFLKESFSTPLLTVKQYNHFKEQFDSSHIVFPEFSQAHEFGYSLNDFDKPIITVDSNCDFPRIKLCKFFIKADKNDRFVAVYILAQQFTLEIFTKQPERLKMFCRIFDIHASVHSYEDEISTVNAECAVFLDGYKEVHAERTMIIGKKKGRTQELSLDLSIAGKYKYRILDVAAKLSPSVIKRPDLFDYDRFKNINK